MSRRIVAVLAAVAVVVVGVGAVVVTGRGGGSAPATTVTTADSGVEVEAGAEHVTVTLDEPADPSAVDAALDDAGVSAQVEGRRTGPSRVGRFVGPSGAGSESAVDQAPDGTTVRFPREERVTLGVGVPTPDGSAYDVATDGFAAAEPFAGLLGLLGRPWVEVEPILRQRAGAAGVLVQVVGSGAGNLEAVEMIASNRARALT